MANNIFNTDKYTSEKLKVVEDNLNRVKEKAESDNEKQKDRLLKDQKKEKNKAITELDKLILDGRHTLAIKNHHQRLENAIEALLSEKRTEENRIKLEDSLFRIKL